MGMDYQYAGSSSYPRFDKELCAVAEVFGGIKTEHLKERKATENQRPFGYWFGFLSSDDSNTPKFTFPEKTNETLIKWFNNVYTKLTVDETKTIWSQISEHTEIETISSQIWNELKHLTQYDECWDIG